MERRGYQHGIDVCSLTVLFIGCMLVLSCQGQASDPVQETDTPETEQEDQPATNGTQDNQDTAEIECEDLRDTGGDCIDTIDSMLAPSTVDLFDSHGHVMPTWTDNVVPTAVEVGNLVGYVALGLDNTLALQQRDSTTYANCAWFDPEDEDFEGLRETLELGARCIGEISLRHFAAGMSTETTCHDSTNTFMSQVFTEASSRQIPVNVHFDYTPDHIGEFKAALDAASTTTFIWAHMGDAPPTAVADMLRAHPNLYVDISSRNPLCTYNPRFVTVDEQRLDDTNFVIKPAWKNLFETFSDRVLFGTDIGPGSRHTQVRTVIEYYRIILGQLNHDAQVKIGHENGQRLFGFPTQ